ncbi:hypothetical protein A4H97_08075 [Niastella yeongjuensis]|uniref:Uncharacterized protein n=1 Tax=Niastella yeongjuensis TaxID=354355 RepID=A0A1V9EN28_9BACT|nr:hypothetical protein [Niastella yeongjuensis]OQP47442.1 hypothetical protein A4H97_08075 [Niastella yeongjuensis]SEN84388.1 hypothetical protein SAMN05660816_01641 [Niastella yeongjuensis]
MKKLLIIFGVFVIGSSLVSCNKKLKDDIDDLKSQVTDLKNQNDSLKTATDTLKSYHDALQQQLKGVINSLGSDEPITAVTTFTDNSGATRTVTGVYKFKSTGYQTQMAIKNSDGSYDIYIQRLSDVLGEEYAWVEFTYNPATKAITNYDGGQQWSDLDPYGDEAYYNSSYGGAGLTFNVTVDSFNTTTGDISMKFAASTTAAYTGGNIPNAGKPTSTNFTFTGKLTIFNIN